MEFYSQLDMRARGAGHVGLIQCHVDHLLGSPLGETHLALQGFLLSFGASRFRQVRASRKEQAVVTSHEAVHLEIHRTIIRDSASSAVRYHWYSFSIFDLESEIDSPRRKMCNVMLCDATSTLPRCLIVVVEETLAWGFCLKGNLVIRIKRTMHRRVLRREGDPLLLCYQN